VKLSSIYEAYLIRDSRSY